LVEFEAVVLIEGAAGLVVFVVALVVFVVTTYDAT
jgi:hypothetical protein